LKDKLKIVYEDALCFIALAENPTTEGHLQVFPQKDIKELEQLDDETNEHMFFAASYAATALFEGLKAQGTNIIISNVINSKHDRIYIDVLARNQDDGIDVLWKPKQLQEEEMNSVLSSIKDQTFYIGKKEEKKNLTPKEVKKVEGDNYMLRHLNKVP
tara:strand:+ start:347 stop:820 length:474 start_codon:yes stop_codon:yes gene_type:complete